ncbi:MAG: DUF3575 domain-containing protein [Bacteroidetes bacterium]|nr:DUF3575 domain-containing protein [Bacteroidota bacterium]MBP9548613.1 DUF3575 domain-containing protein [Chitinophagales bacterium]
MRNTLIFSITILLGFSSYAQDPFLKDSLPEFKNNIKLNVSSFAIYDKAFIMSYERIINNKQSMSFEFGAAALPTIDSLAADGFYLSKENQNKGFKIAFDYRFYPQKENKFSAPRGIYIGPFLAFYHFDKQNSFQFIDSNSVSVDLNVKANIYQAGFEVGYHFIFYKRWSVDLLLMGPALSFYSTNINLSSTVSSENELVQDFYQALANKYPGFSTLVNEGEITTTGRTDFFAGGFRYSVSIGFLF